MNNFDYQYTSLEDGARQYDDIDLIHEKIVDARYVKSKIKHDNGNPFIEALPRPREGREEITNAYLKNIETFTEKQRNEFVRSEKLAAVTLLRELRYPLPFHEELEEETYNALVTSYRSRYLQSDADIEHTYAMNNTENTMNSKVFGSDASSTSAGFSLLGYSGCGKSSAIQILLSNYPQVIMHQNGTLNRFPQIVYLVVNCIANSNFSALYASIGHAIDKALGNMNPVYERIIEKEKGLAAKAGKVKDLVEKFAIGIIIFDEIQLIDFKSTRENSFESLMTLSNRTKVAIAVVGTEDAYEMMFSKLRTGRRVGTVIKAHSYCSNYRYFSFLVKKLMEYQWFDEIVMPTEELIQALYEESKGIIDQLISIYMYMQIDYIRKKNKPKIDAEYVRKTMDKHYPGLKDLLNDINNPYLHKERNEIISKAMKEMETIIEQEKQKASAVELESFITSPEQVNNQIIKDNILRSVQMLMSDFTTDTIIHTIEKVMNLKSSKGLTEQEIGSKVFKQLSQGKTDKRPKTKKSDSKLDTKHIDMKQYILNE